MAKTPEAKVKDQIKAELKAEGLVPLNDFIKLGKAPAGMRGFFFMPVAGPFSVHGIHDVVGCWDSVFFSIEAKAPDAKEDGTPMQVDFQRAVHHAGGVAIIGARSGAVVQQLKAAVQKVLDGRKDV